MPSEDLEPHISAIRIQKEGYPLTDTLMALFNSLMFLEISLLSKNNSLLRILGNFGKKHWSLLWFLTSQTSK